ESYRRRCEEKREKWTSKGFDFSIFFLYNRKDFSCFFATLQQNGLQKSPNNVDDNCKRWPCKIFRKNTISFVTDGMNASQNDQLVVVADESMSILWQCMISILVFMLAGLVAMFTSLINVLAILKSKEMKSKFYALYVETGVVDFLMGSVYVATGVKKIYRYFSGVGDAMTRRQCCQESALLYFCQTLGLYVAFTLALDRTVSFLKPSKIYHVWYRSIDLIQIFLKKSVKRTKKDDFGQELLISCGTATCRKLFRHHTK
uniref:Uncharacterized protein n=1 Tax=Romanomermis culicivorax TaxID=13658 RepID=A0A915K434_ROMCU